MFSSVLLLLPLLVNWGLFGSVSGSPAVEEAYKAVVGVVSPGQQTLTRQSLRTLFNTLEIRVQCGEVPCEKCNLLDAVHQLIGNHSIHGEDDTGTGRENFTVSVAEFPAVASGCVLYLTSPGLVCTAVQQGRWGEETEHFLHKVTHGEQHEEREPHHDHEHIGIHGLETVLQELHNHYEPADSEHGDQSCVTVNDIMTEVGADSADQPVGAVLGRVLYHALLGHCFIGQSLPEESFFLDYIMNRLGSENFTVGDLKALMRSLNLGPNDHEDEHENGHDHHDEHTGHDYTAGRWSKRSRHGHHEEHERNATWEEHCFSAEELVMIYNLPENSSASSGLGRSDLARLSPALVQQILSGACTNIIEPTHTDGLTKTERYLYATLANVVITLASMFGIVLLLFTACTNFFQLCIQFCISLAAGTLTGDALLHLLPMFLGLHVHTNDNSGHSHHSHEEETSDYIYKMLVLIAGIYGFYLIESIFSRIKKDTDSPHHHQHHHGEDSEPHHCDHGRVLEMYQERRQRDKSQSASKADLVEDNERSPNPIERTREQRLLPFMITFGDGLHNFADGLAIGAAFSLSWRTGLATSVAVFCHELPHELGDFAILLYTGMSVRRALLLNVGSAMTSFIGLYVALSVATDIATNQWIAAISSGLFLYVGLADMLPTMIHSNHKRPWLIFLLQNIGLLSGWAILLLLSLYEESISF